MSKVICCYCKKEYSNNSILLNHQKTTKKCLEIQKKLKIDTNIINYGCKYCKKLFTSKYRKETHEIKCLLKDTESEEILSLKEENQKLKDKMQKISEENISLTALLQIHKESTDRLYEIAKQDTNNIYNNISNSNNRTNKNLNFNSTLNLNDIDKISEIIQNNYNLEHFLQGQKGIANFVFENFLKDEDGNVKYICSDPSRKIFNYKTDEGDIEKDVNANKLTNGIVKGGIKEKTVDIASNWYTKEDDTIDHDKFNIAVKNQESILEIDKNNNTFKGELAKITYV